MEQQSWYERPILIKTFANNVIPSQIRDATFRHLALTE